MKLTVYHDGQFFVGLIEQEMNGCLYAAKYIFGPEPSDEEIYFFIQQHMLLFFQSFATHGVEIKRKERPKNTKRLLREAARELKRTTHTKAQEAIRLSFEAYKTERKMVLREQRDM